MSSNAVRIDERAVRTRNAIARAVIQLGRRHGIDRLTVSEVTQAAGVSRSSFYAHFESLEDYLARSFAGMLERLAEHEARQASGGPVQILPVTAILAHVASAPDFAAAISRSKYRPAMLRAGERRLTPLIENRLALQRPELAAADRCVMARFIAAGFIGILRDWTESGIKLPPDVIRRQFETILERL